MNKLVRILMPIILSLSVILVSACAAAPPSEMAPPAPMPPGAEESFVGKGLYPGGEEAGVDRKIVRNGYLTLEVMDIAETMDGVAEVADELGGYVVSSDKHERDNRTFGSVTFRVPADRFDDAFDRLRQLAIDVPYEMTESRDVTEEYTDLEAQLHNLEAAEAQYLALLDRAETVEDILAVQRELSNLRGQIERVKGRMQYLERTSDMALIEVSLRETEALAGPWSVINTLKSAVRGLITVGKVLASVFIWLGIFCWVWVPPLVIWLRRRRKVKS